MSLEERHPRPWSLKLTTQAHNIYPTSIVDANGKCVIPHVEYTDIEDITTLIETYNASPEQETRLSLLKSEVFSAAVEAGKARLAWLDPDNPLGEEASYKANKKLTKKVSEYLRASSREEVSTHRLGSIVYDNLGRIHGARFFSIADEVVYHNFKLLRDSNELDIRLLRDSDGKELNTKQYKEIIVRSNIIGRIFELILRAEEEEGARTVFWARFVNRVSEIIEDERRIQTLEIE